MMPTIFECPLSTDAREKSILDSLIQSILLEIINAFRSRRSMRLLLNNTMLNILHQSDDRESCAVLRKFRNSRIDIRNQIKEHTQLLIGCCYESCSTCTRFDTGKYEWKQQHCKGCKMVFYCSRRCQ